MSYFIGAMFLLLLCCAVSVAKKAMEDLMAAERKLTEDLRKDLADVRKILDQLIEAVEVSKIDSENEGPADVRCIRCGGSGEVISSVTGAKEECLRCCGTGVEP